MQTHGNRSSAPLGVGLVQLEPRKADVPGNLETILDWVSRVGGEHDILVFPEVSLSGYFLEGGVAEVAITVEDLADRLGTADEGAPDLVLGFYERWRRGVYNSVAYFEAEASVYRPVHVHRKLFLPTYGIFEEARFVDPGRDLFAFDTRFGRMGLLVCEDMWHSLPATVLALDGAEMILVVSASPAREFPRDAGKPGNLARWDDLVRGAALEHGLFVGVCQLVGSEGGKVFPGGSVVAGPDGNILARGPLMEEGLVSVVLSGGDIDRARFESPLLSDLQQMLPHLQRALDRSGTRGLAGDEDEEEEEVRGGREGVAATLGGRRKDRRATSAPDPNDVSVLELDLDLVRAVLVDFIRQEVVVRRGFEGVVLGVSGGVDSSVALHLAVQALGPEAVTGFRLPYATSSPESLEHAEMVLEATGARSETIDITPAVDALIGELGGEISDLRRGNLAARTRAITLFDQSARLRRLPLGTGNKSERLLGYYTWHADDSPPINPLGDLFKTQVWALARYLGLPEAIVDKPASADLIRGIHDEDELGFPYHKADPILYWLLRGFRSRELIDLGFDARAVKAVWGRLNGTHWKRELPTVAVLSSTAIGQFYLRPVDYQGTRYEE